MTRLLSRTFFAISLSTSLSACDVYHRPSPTVKCTLDAENQKILVSSIFQDKVHNISILNAEDGVLSGFSEDGVRVVFNTNKNQCYGHRADMKEMLSLKYDYRVVPKL